VVRVQIKTRPEVLRRNRETNVNIYIKGEEGEEVLLTQKVLSTPWYIREHRSKWLTAPLVIEGNILNMNSNGQGLIWGSVQGQIVLNKDKRFDFSYRSDSYTSNFTSNTAIRQLSYLSPKFRVTLGTQIDFINMQINGDGIGVEYTPNESKQQSLRLVKSNINSSYQVIYTHDQQISPVLRYSSKSVFNNDIQSQSNCVFLFNEVKWLKDQYTTLTVELGNSYERLGLTRSSHWGTSLGYRLNISKDKYSLVSSYTYASSYFPGLIRGLRFGSHELRYQPGAFFISAYGTNNSRLPAILNPLENTFDPKLEFQSEEWGVKLGESWQKKFSLTAVGNFQKLLQTSLTERDVRGWGSSVTFTFNPTPSLDASLTANWRRAGLVNTSDRFSTTGLFGQMRHKGVGTTFRYVEGPQFYMDYLNLKDGGSTARLIQASVFGEWSTKNKHFQARYQLMFNQTPTLAGKIANRSDIIWNLPAQGMSLILSGMTGQHPERNSQPMFNITFRKMFDVPLPLVQKYGNLKVILYKDLNYNDTLDATDERIGRTLVTINHLRLRSNSKGEVFLKNVQPGDYLVDLSNTQTLRGWSPREGLKQSVEVLNDAYLAIPFNKSRYVSGRLSVEKDAYSMNSTTLDGVRVTALSSKGETHHAITNLEGAFFFNLAPDEYIIQVKEDVMGSEYRITESSQKVNLNEKETFEVEFRAVQRKRQINIRKK